jgi:hypothetical protein
VLSDAKSRQYYDKTGSTEGIDVSAEDFLAGFYAVMQESLGGLSIQVRSRPAEQAAAGAVCDGTGRLASARRRQRS